MIRVHLCPSKVEEKKSFTLKLSSPSKIPRFDDEQLPARASLKISSKDIRLVSDLPLMGYFIGLISNTVWLFQFQCFGAQILHLPNCLHHFSLCFMAFIILHQMLPQDTTQQSITLTKLIEFYRSLTSPSFHQFLLYFLRLLLPMAAAQLLWSRHHTPLREAALFEHHAGAGGDHARQRNGEELRHFSRW